MSGTAKLAQKIAADQKRLSRLQGRAKQKSQKNVSRPKGTKKSFKPKAPKPSQITGPRKTESKTRNVEAPVSTFRELPQATFAGGGKAPRHKEWGEGERFVGCVPFAKIQQQPGTGTLMVEDSPITSDFMVYTEWNTTSIAGGVLMNAYRNWLPIHPTKLKRASAEARNWSRYVFRRVKITYHPLSQTGTANGLTIALTHGVSIPFEQGWLTSDSSTSPGILQTIVPSVTTTFWNAAEVKMDEFTSDKTWPTTYPVIETFFLNDDVEVGPLYGSQLAEMYIQHMVGCQQSIATATGTFNQGILFIEFTIDFYGPRYTTDNVAIGYFTQIILDEDTKKEAKKRSRKVTPSGGEHIHREVTHDTIVYSSIWALLKKHFHMVRKKTDQDSSSDEPGGDLEIVEKPKKKSASIK